jgi:hypothetical protein
MTTWILLFIVSVVLTLVRVLLGNKAESPAYRKANYDNIIRRIKQNSESIHFTFEECTFTRIDAYKKARRKTHPKSTSLGVNRKTQREEVKESKTEIICSKLDARKEFVGIFPIDLDIAKTKTLQNSGITVYVEKEDEYTSFEEEEYYMDLSFLET